jgi:hypothetical protein
MPTSRGTCLTISMPASATRFTAAVRLIPPPGCAGSCQMKVQPQEGVAADMTGRVRCYAFQPRSDLGNSRSAAPPGAEGDDGVVL